MPTFRLWRPAALLLVALLGLAGAAAGEEPKFDPAQMNQALEDFTLPVYQGGDLTLSSLKGKTVLLVFPRGYYGPNDWCNICNYQYSELVELERTEQIRRKHNLEIVVVLPYGREILADWLDKIPAQLAGVEGWKNPPDPEKLSQGRRAWMEFARREYPLKIEFEQGKVPTPFPILMDDQHALSQKLGLFTTDWNGSKVDQNIPSVMILDAQGVVRYKYMGQVTTDRPRIADLIRFIEKMMPKS